MKRYEDQLTQLEGERRDAIYELYQQLTFASTMTGAGGSSSKWLHAQQQVDPRIRTRSLDDLYAAVGSKRQLSRLMAFRPDDV